MSDKTERQASTSGTDDMIERYRAAFVVQETASSALLLETTKEFEEKIEILQFDERHLHSKFCSALCGLVEAQEPAADFKELYRKASLALGEQRRNSRNPRPKRN